MKKIKYIDISKEMEILRTSINTIQSEKQPIAQSLYNELLFMQDTLLKLRTTVEKEGPTSLFKQGSQEFLREHPALKSYNTIVSKYGILYKQLADLIPTNFNNLDDPLIDFIEEE